MTHSLQGGQRAGGHNSHQRHPGLPGQGHSCGIYSKHANIMALASNTKTSRVMVNQRRRPPTAATVERHETDISSAAAHGAKQRQSQHHMERPHQRDLGQQALGESQGATVDEELFGES